MKHFKLFALMGLLLVSVCLCAQSVDGTFKTLNATTASTNTYTLTESLPATYTTGEKFIVRFSNANTGAATLNRNGLGAKPIKKANNVSLSAGDIQPGAYLLSYNGTYYQIVGDGGSGGGGTGTVTDVSVTTANGVSGTVATSTTTPAITLTLGAITPTSVAATGSVTGSNLSGTNTGDQDLSTFAVKSNNLSDLSNAVTARTNLGLGTLATQDGTFSGTSSGINTGDQDLSGLVVKANNLSDLTNATTARSNLGLGTLATQDGTFSGTSSGTNTGDQDLSGLMVKSNNLSDLTNTTTARSNLGLGTLATQSGTFSGTSSGTNTGDQTTISGNAGTATTLQTGRTIGITGDVTYTSPTFNGSANVTAAATVTRINGVALSGLATGILKNTTTTGVPSIAVAGDFPTLNQNTTGSAATLTTARNINGTAFNGSADITVTAAAGTLTGTTLNSTVVNSSLTSLGTVTSGTLSTGAVVQGVTMTLGSDGSYDLYYRNASGVLTRLAAGSDGFVLTTHSTTSAPTWTSPSAGSGLTFQQTLTVSFLNL